MSKPIAGVCFLYINGKSYSTTGEFDVKILAEKNNSVVDSNGTVYKSVEPVASTISGDIFITEDLNIDAIHAIDNGTVIVELRNGRTATLGNAHFSGDGSVTAHEGQLMVEFTGQGKWV